MELFFLVKLRSIETNGFGVAVEAAKGSRKEKYWMFLEAFRQICFDFNLIFNKV